jgi:hypothetical protein
MTESCKDLDAGPSCFHEALDQEWHRIRNRMMRYLFRDILSKYPVDLVRVWWTREGCMPWPMSQLAFERYKAGHKPGPLYKGPPHRPQLKVIEGGKTVRK